MLPRKNNFKHFGQRYIFSSHVFLCDPRSELCFPSDCRRGCWHRNFGRPCRVLQRGTSLTTHVVSDWKATVQTDNALTIFLPTSKQLRQTRKASPTLLKLFMLEAEMFLHKMLTPGFCLHADADLSHIFENDGTLFADQVVQSIRHIFRSRHVCDDEGDKLAPVQLHGSGVVRRRSLGFLSQ